VKNFESIGVIGLGKLGLPLALCLSQHFPTIGVDKNEKLVNLIGKGEYHGMEPGISDLLSKQVNSPEKLKFSTKVDDLINVNCVFIILPTLSLQDGSFDGELIKSSVRDLIELWKNCGEDKTIVIVSTLSPGSTQEIYREIVEPANRIFQSEITLVYSPEFIALGSVLHDLEFPDMILVGTLKGDANTIHEKIQKKMAKNSPQAVNLNYVEAEFAKILVNTYITMKISFANFIGELGSRIEDLTPTKVAFAVGLDGRINNKYLRPGLPFSGPCFPRDNKALISSARAVGLKANLAIATDDINGRQMEFLSERVLKYSKAAKRYCIFGLSYKVGSDVIEESAGIKLANYLSELGFQVQCHDPAITVRPASLVEEVQFLAGLNEIDDFEQGVVLTDWPVYELEFGNSKKVLFLSKIDQH